MYKIFKLLLHKFYKYNINFYNISIFNVLLKQKIKIKKALKAKDKLDKTPFKDTPTTKKRVNENISSRNIRGSSVSIRSERQFKLVV